MHSISQETRPIDVARSSGRGGRGHRCCHRGVQVVRDAGSGRTRAPGVDRPPDQPLLLEKDEAAERDHRDRREDGHAVAEMTSPTEARKSIAMRPSAVRRG